MKKKILVAILATTMALSITACGGESPSPDAETESNAEESAIEETNDVTDDSGFEIVDNINIDTNEISLKYTGYNIVDGTDNDGNPIKEIVVYFDFSNKTSVSERIHEAVSIDAFQNGVQLTNWLGDVDGNESVENSYKNIIDGATLNVGVIFELEDTENAVKIRISNSYSDIYGENSELFSQEQEIEIQ